MDHDAVLALFDRQLRRDVRADRHGVRVERVGEVVRQIGVSDEDWAAVIWSDLDEATADAAIAAQVRHFAALGREFEWKLYAHDRPGDLAARLRAAGFRPEPEETLMVARISDLSLGVELPEGVRLLAVTDPSGVDLAADAHERAFGTSAAHLRQRMLSQLAETPETFRLVVAMAGDVPVCAARMELNPGTDFAGLWGGGTVAEWRGRGIYRALVAYRARIAAELGYRYLQVDASSQSRPILQRLGFAALSTTTPYMYQP
jgi:GNAT superfamily N-acetyltransferase